MTNVQREIAKTRTKEGIQSSKIIKKKIPAISEKIVKFADENDGAVGKQGFTNLLKKLTKGNVVAHLKDYNKKFPEKSIISLILSESMSDEADQKEALIGNGRGKNHIIGIYTLLLEHAKDVGVDQKTLNSYRQDFTNELDAQLGKFMSSIRFDSTRLDDLMNALIQTIDNHKGKKPASDSQVNLKGSGAKVSKTQSEAYNTAANRFNKAQKDFNKQMQQDGWAGDVADAFGRIYGSKNVASKVRADLKECKAQLNELDTALKEGDTAFRAKFNEIYGTPYNAQNIQAYKNIEKTYLEAAKVKATEDAFKNDFSLLLNKKPLSEEGQMVTQSVSAGTQTYTITATKAEVYNREFNKLAKAMGENGTVQLNKIINQTVGAKASIEKKYEVLQNFATGTLQKMRNDTQKACGGRSFDSIQHQYDNSYKAAYGVKNDIMKRVTDYNISQQKGAGVVKGIATALLTFGGTILAVGTGGASIPATMAAVGGVAAAAPAVVEVSDRATSGKALNSLRNKGLSEWLKTTNESTDWKSVAKTSLTNGALALVFMGQSYAVTGLCMKAGLGATATGVANAAGTVATGLGSEYLMTGQISVEGAIFTVTMAVVGGVMTVKSIKAANAAEVQTRTEQHAADIQAARQTLGFEDGVKITPEGLKAQYKKLAIQNHPDKGGTTANMTEINIAYDFLNKNLADLNIAAPNTNAVKSTPKPKTEQLQIPENSQINPVLEVDEGIPLVKTTQNGDIPRSQSLAHNDRGDCASLSRNITKSDDISVGTATKKIASLTDGGGSQIKVKIPDKRTKTIVKKDNNGYTITTGEKEYNVKTREEASKILDKKTNNNDEIIFVDECIRKDDFDDFDDFDLNILTSKIKFTSKYYDDIHIGNGNTLHRKYTEYQMQGLSKEEIFNKFYDTSKMSKLDIAEARASLDKYVEKLENIDASFDNLIPNTIPHTYYRGILDDYESNHALQVINNAQIGDEIIIDYGYAQTSTKKEVAECFSNYISGDANNPQESVVITIKTKIGDKISTSYSSMAKAVFPRAAKYKVISKKIKNNKTYVTVEYLQEKKSTKVK